jgi:hypothetical protein
MNGGLSEWISRYRWGEDGEWNLEERANGADTDLKPRCWKNVMTSLALIFHTLAVRRQSILPCHIYPAL